MSVRWPLVLLLSLLVRLLPAQELIPYRQGRLWGYADAHRRLVIRPRYDYAERFDQGLAKVWRGDKCGFIDRRGREVVPLQFDRAGYTLRYERAHWAHGAPPAGWPGGHGLLVVALRDPARVHEPFTEALAHLPPALHGWAAWSDAEWRESGFRWGLYDTTGRELLPPRYAYLRRRTDGLLTAGFVDGRFDGEVASGCFLTYYRDYPLYKEVLLSPRGQPLLHGEAFSSFGEVREGRIQVQESFGPDQDFQLTLLDTARAARSAPADRRWFQRIEPLGPGLLEGVYEEFNQGYGGGPPSGLDKEPTPPDHSGLNGAAYYPSYNANKELLGLDLQPIGPPRRYTLLWRVGPAALVAGVVEREGPRVGLLDATDGHWLLCPEFEALDVAGAGNLLFRHGGHWGLMSQQGRTLQPAQYEEYHRQPDGTFRVRRGSQWGVIDGQGREVLPLVYAELTLIVPLRQYVAGLAPMGPEPADQVRPRGLRYGLLNRRGRVLVAPAYEALEPCLDERYQPLPLWQARRGGQVTLIDSLNHPLFSLGPFRLFNFEQGRAWLRPLEGRPATPASSERLMVVQENSRFRLEAQRPRPDSPVRLSYPAWRTPDGRRLLRWERVNEAAPRSAYYSETFLYGLTTADSTSLAPLTYHELSAQILQREGDYAVIGPYLLARRGQRFGVLDTQGREVLPPQYPELHLPPGTTGVFWVRRPEGFAVLDGQGRVLRQTTSPTLPPLPQEFLDGYGLLLGGRGSQVSPQGYVNELGQPFFEEVPAKPAPARR
jgi:hypothetical protein